MAVAPRIESGLEGLSPVTMATVLHGVVPALLTPFSPRGGARVDEEAFTTLIEHLIDAGVSGLFVCGTTGEWPLLTIEERKALASRAVAAARGRVRVVVQTGAMTTGETIRLCRHARENGADGLAVVAPYYYRLEARELVSHLVAAARSVADLPVYIYNIPSHTGNDFTSSIVAEVAGRCSNVVGLKDTTKDLDRFQEYRSRLKGLSIIMGSDSLILPALLLGAEGAVTAIGNVFPELVAGLYKSFKKGKIREAVQAQERVNLARAILKVGPPFAAYKAALGLKGIPMGGGRGPIAGLTQRQVGALQVKLKEAGLL